MTAPMPAVRVRCEGCDAVFEAKTKRARFCSARCQKRVAVAARKGVAAPAPAGAGELTAAVVADLTTAGVEGSWAGRAAVVVARQIETPGVSAIPALLARLESLMGQALGPQKPTLPGTPEEPAEMVEDEIARAKRERDERRRSAAG